MESSLGSTPPTKKIKTLTVASQAKNKGTAFIVLNLKIYKVPANLPLLLSSVVL